MVSHNIYFIFFFLHHISLIFSAPVADWRRKYKRNTFVRFAVFYRKWLWFYRSTRYWKSRFRCCYHSSYTQPTTVTRSNVDFCTVFWSFFLSFLFAVTVAQYTSLNGSSADVIAITFCIYTFVSNTGFHFTDWQTVISPLSHFLLLYYHRYEW